MSKWNWVGWTFLAVGLIVSVILGSPASASDVFAAALLLFIALDKS